MNASFESHSIRGSPIWDWIFYGVPSATAIVDSRLVVLVLLLVFLLVFVLEIPGRSRTRRRTSNELLKAFG